jgi:hypothetical protein
MTGSDSEPSVTHPAGPSPSTTQRLMTAREVSHESGLREDLVVRFVPPIETPNGPFFGPRQLVIARVVRQLTGIGTPASTVVAAVENLNARPDNEVAQLAVQSERARPPGTKRRRALVVVATAVIALAVGGLIGGFVSRADRSSGGGSLAAPVTVTVSASPQTLQPAIPTAPDPVCGPWATATNDYRTKETAWSNTDSSIPASQWSPEQRSITMNVIPVLRQEAADLRGFAAKATDPTLRFLMQLEAAYQEAFADRLPNFAGPDDKRLWQAAINADVMIDSLCHAVVPPK